jgi:hypothetical protein
MEVKSMFRKIGILVVAMTVAVAVSDIVSAQCTIKIPPPIYWFACLPWQMLECKDVWLCRGNDAYPAEVCVCKNAWDVNVDWVEVIKDILWGISPIPPEPFPTLACKITVIALGGDASVCESETICPTSEDVLNMIDLWADGQVSAACVFDIVDTWSTCHNIRGDANFDCIVNGQDLAMLGKSWNSSIGSPSYDIRVDFNGDGRVDLLDLAILGKNHGKTCK